MDVSLALLQESLQMNCAAAFLCAQQVVPAMVEAAKGTIIFTGATASLKGSAGFSQFGKSTPLEGACHIGRVTQ